MLASTSRGPASQRDQPSLLRIYGAVLRLRLRSAPSAPHGLGVALRAQLQASDAARRCPRWLRQAQARQEQRVHEVYPPWCPSSLGVQHGAFPIDPAGCSGQLDLQLCTCAATHRFPFATA